MKTKIAQFGGRRRSQTELGIDDITRIYELTYKLQMLESEEKFGDQGLPSILPDKAYMMKPWLESELEAALDEAVEPMTATYDWWIGNHEPSEWDLLQQIYERENEYFREWLKYEVKTVGDLTDRLPEEGVLEFLQEFVADHNLSTEDFLDENIRYLYPDRYPETKQAQEEQLDLPIEYTPKAIPEDLQQRNLPTPGGTDLEAYENIFQAYKEEICEGILGSSMVENAIESGAQDSLEDERAQWEDDSALGSVKEVRSQLEEWDSNDLSGKVILFQEALTTAHNNGEMAEYLLDSGDAVKLLHQLSKGKGLAEWDRDLTQWLAHPPMSNSTPPDVWFNSARKRLAKVLAHLLKFERDINAQAGANTI